MSAAGGNDDARGAGAGGVPGQRPIRTLLIANRGEIAVRVARGARALGIRTVAIFSDADAGAPHVLAADTAVRVGPTPAAQSYLDVDRVLAAAAESGADAVHPGYGFLSENPDFADRCVAAGLTFVGPSGDAMRALGDKARAKAIAARADVPTVPEYAIDAVPHDAYPVLVKAAAGGGGRGMRRVDAPGDLAEAVASARREAAAAFGSDELLVERLVTAARHVEVQLLADARGTALAIGDRDCSLQRRHQKVVEEAPAPGLPQELRRNLADATVRLAQAADYVGAGTAEFLVTETGEWFFLELNARLQVEHPVTEQAFGVDLVALQLRVAAGEPVGVAQGDVLDRAHAIEVRLYAEHPVDFLPTGGRVLAVRLPSGEGIRVDHVLAAGRDVPLAYDPLLAKVIATGATREQARERLVAALRELVVLGAVTNRELLLHALELPDFVEVTHDVATLEAQPLDGAALDVPPGIATRARAVVRHALAGAATPFESLGAWRGAGTASGVGDTTAGLVDGPLLVDGELAVALAGDSLWVASPSGTWQVDRDHLAGAAARGEGARGGAADDTDARLVAPMPGTVISAVADGTVVEAGDTVVVLEAMKMENAIAAPFAGTVSNVSCAPGALVSRGTLLAEVTRAQSSDVTAGDAGVGAGAAR